MTTPNAEYNVRFENLRAGALRHADHRFEWTRAEFAEWCAGVCSQFGYTVRLAALGDEDPTLGGPSQELSAKGNVRRTVYARISRHRLDPTLNLFYFPDPNVTSAARPITTVPQQQLFALNSEFMIDQAKAFARRVQSAAKDERERIEAAFALAFGKAPTAEQIRLGLEFLA